MGCVYGPVPSRRLGRSLGVDIVPLKTCTYDCIYCQLGRTTCRTIERREYLPLRDVLAQVRAKLPSRPDFVTLCGSGEPTLYSRIDELIDGIQAATEIPVAVLTNGSLLWRPEVRRQLLGADVVAPSLDAADEATFQAVNRPHEEISFERMLDGLVAFRDDYGGQIWLEVMLLEGLTGTEATAARLAACAARVRADRVQLNTATRPPAEEAAVGVPRERMEHLAGLFGPRAEVIAEFRGTATGAGSAAGREEVLALLRRRPCSVQDVAAGLGMQPNEAIKYIDALDGTGLLKRARRGGKLYYSADGA